MSSVQLLESQRERIARIYRPERDTLLSRREVDIVRLLAEGLTNKEIALNLEISTETVKTHICHVLRKFRALNRTHAVAIAIRNQHI